MAVTAAVHARCSDSMAIHAAPLALAPVPAADSSESTWLCCCACPCDGELKPATLNLSVFKLRTVTVPTLGDQSECRRDCQTSDVTVGTEHMQWAE
jgi:hypothetical protein